MQTFVVRSESGYWGKGTTAEVATRKAIEAGAKKTDNGLLSVFQCAETEVQVLGSGSIEAPMECFDTQIVVPVKGIKALLGWAK